jgi:hypothetical protein
MYFESLKNGISRQIIQIFGQKLSKFDENYKLMDSRNSMKAQGS